MRLPVLDADKANHLIYGLAIYIFCAWLAQQVEGTPPGDARLIGVACTVVLGLIWEGIQSLQNRAARRRGQMPTHQVDELDALATFLGGLAGWAAAAWTGGVP